MTNYPRILRDVAYSGSNATGECSLQIVAGNVVLGEVWNSPPYTSTPTNVPGPEALKPINAYIPANRMLEVEMLQDSTTDHTMVELDFVPAGIVGARPRSRFRRRNFGYNRRGR